LELIIKIIQACLLKSKRVWGNVCSLGYFQHVSLDTTVETVQRGVVIVEVRNPVIMSTDPVLGHVILGIGDGSVTRVC
jgi:hypothetical protein